jgi:hypothetical protein
MSFYVYKLVEPLILPNTSTSLSAKSYQLAYQLSAIFTKQSQYPEKLSCIFLRQVGGDVKS